LVPHIGELEAQVMAVVWAAPGQVTVREVLEAVNGGRRQRQLAYTTVLSVVTNLHAKGMLRRDTRGRAYAYTAAMSPEEYTAGLMNEALQSSADRTAALLHFAAQLDDSERAALAKQARRFRRR
jgi:predicted transcriptional regulator